MRMTFPMSRNAQMTLCFLGVINFFILSLTSYLALKSLPSVRTVSDGVLKDSQSDGTQNPTTFNPILWAKLNRISHELNVSGVATDEALISGDAITSFVYVMHNPRLCQGVDVVDFIIIVHSAPANLERRKRIRESFAKESLFLPFHVRVAFLLGRTTNQTLDDLVRKEHLVNNDSVAGDFIDSYHNLTFKGVMGYRWVSEHCRNAKFVLKIDDDVIVNTFALLQSFYKHMNRKRSIFCNVWQANTMEILRQGKWQVSDHIFRNHHTFPYSYCSGFVVILTADLMAPLSQAARLTPFFWIDDVYLFGMLPYVVGGVTFHHYCLDQFLSLQEQVLMRCLNTSNIECSVFASVVRDNSFWFIWDMILHKHNSMPWSIETELVV
ncbi:beta-1,3-galactosyltransferase 1 [Biomphalaria glabrata]|nr:beta-1,3-galactosyltransferase 1 [Biomphalaria glabrata]